MSFNPETGRMDWRDELQWLLIAIVSGIALAWWYIQGQHFPNANPWMLGCVCALAFYSLSILLRIQNQRVRALIGRPAVEERSLKYLFPLLGFGIGLAIIAW